MVAVSISSLVRLLLMVTSISIRKFREQSIGLPGSCIRFGSLTAEMALNLNDCSTLSTQYFDSLVVQVQVKQPCLMRFQTLLVKMNALSPLKMRLNCVYSNLMLYV